MIPFNEAGNETFADRPEIESLGLDSMTCKLIYHHKDMTAASDLPVATLSVPVAVVSASSREVDSRTVLPNWRR